jgi:hypothetical protein
VYLHRARERRGRPRPRLEPLRFYMRLVTHPIGKDFRVRCLPLMALLVLSQAAYGAGYYWERVTRSASHAPTMSTAK